MKFIDRVAKHAEQFTRKDRVLVEYLIARHPHGVLESATSIAKNIGVSPATVVRFFSKLQYRSFAEAQREAREDISTKLTSPLQRANLTTRREHSIEDIVNRVFAFDRENLSATLEELDMAAFQSIVDALLDKSVRRIYVMGVKNSEGIAQYFYTHLNMCLPNVQLLGTGGASSVDNLFWIDRSDVLLAISIRRYSKATIQAARYFHQHGARVISLTDSPLSPITALSSQKLLIKTMSASPFDSFTSACSVINALIAVITHARRQQTKAVLSRAETLWEHFDVFLQKRDGLS